MTIAKGDKVAIGKSTKVWIVTDADDLPQSEFCTLRSVDPDPRWKAGKGRSPSRPTYLTRTIEKSRLRKISV